MNEKRDTSPVAILSFLAIDLWLSSYYFPTPNKPEVERDGEK